MNFYLRLLAVFYFVGFGLHAADLLDWRLAFSEMNFLWKSWVVFLTVGDLVTALGLWRRKQIGIIGFHVVAVLQLIAYIGYSGFFGRQTFLIAFHIATMGAFYFLLVRNRMRLAPRCH